MVNPPMPLHALEPCAYPETLFDTPLITQGNTCWWAFYTRPRMRKSLARRLREREVSFFLPLYRRRWKQRGRAFNAYLPLFPGYLFVYGDFDARLSALQTNLVVSTLSVPDQGRLRTDLLQIHRLLTT